MADGTDRIGGIMRDLGIALGVTFVIAYAVSAWHFHELNPLVGVMSMISVLIVHGWLAGATWHGGLALLVLLVLFFLIVTLLRNPSVGRILVFVLWFLAWGAYGFYGPELLGDGL